MSLLPERFFARQDRDTWKQSDGLRWSWLSYLESCGANNRGDYAGMLKFWATFDGESTVHHLMSAIERTDHDGRSAQDYADHLFLLCR
jgi:hypothetical protein